MIYDRVDRSPLKLPSFVGGLLGPIWGEVLVVGGISFGTQGSYQTYDDGLRIRVEILSGFKAPKYRVSRISIPLRLKMAQNPDTRWCLEPKSLKYKALQP